MQRSGWTWSWSHEDSTQFEPPAEIELWADTMEVTRGVAWRRVRPDMTSYRPAEGRWMPPSEDSVVVVWSNGYTGSTLRMGLSGDSMIGVVFASTDDDRGLPAPSAEVALRAQACAPRDMPSTDRPVAASTSGAVLMQRRTAGS